MARLTLDQVEAKIAAALEAKTIRNADLADLKQDAQRSYETDKNLTRDNVFGARGYLELSTNAQECWDAVPFEMRHCATKKMPKATTADGCVLNALVARWAPVAVRLRSLKALAVKGRAMIPVTPAKIAEMEADAAQRCTCQICGRSIHAALGTIAHHGYRRPGEGYQTASCYGAKRLPFEVDRTALGEWIVMLQRMLVNEEQHLANLRTGTVVLKAEEVKRDARGNRVLENGQSVMIIVEYAPGHDDYARRLKIAILLQERQVKDTKDEIENQTGRFKAWAQASVPSEIRAAVMAELDIDIRKRTDDLAEILASQPVEKTAVAGES